MARLSPVQKAECYSFIKTSVRKLLLELFVRLLSHPQQANGFPMFLDVYNGGPKFLV